MGQIGDSRPFDSLIESFCLYLTSQRMSESTVRNYRSDLERLKRWWETSGGSVREIWKISAADVQKYRRAMMRTHAIASVNRNLAALRRFLTWAADTGQIDPRGVPRVQSADSISGRRIRPRWLTREEQVRLLDTVRSGGVARDLAFVALTLSTGLRVTEICTVLWRDVTIRNDKGILRIYRSKKSRQIQLALDREAMDALKSYGYAEHAGKAERLFPGRVSHISRRWLELLVDRYCKLAGLEGVTPATLRHTFIRNAVLAGMDPIAVAQLVGDGSLELVRYCYSISTKRKDVF